MPNKRNSRRNPKRRTNVSSARKSEQPNAEAFGLTRKTSGPALNLTAIIVSFPEFCPRATNYPRARAKLRRSLRKACEIRAKCRRRSSGVHPRQNPRLYKFLSETGVAPASTSAQQWPPSSSAPCQNAHSRAHTFVRASDTLCIIRRDRAEAFPEGKDGGSPARRGMYIILHILATR